MCKVQMLPHRLTDTWPTLPPTGVHVLSDSGDFPAPPLPLPSPAAQPIWAPVGASGVWAVREGVSHHFLRAVLIFSVPTPTPTQPEWHSLGRPLTSRGD